MVYKILNKRILEFLKYGVASLVALGADVGTLFFLVQLFHVYYLLAACISFIIGIAITYYLSIYWVFTKRVLKDKQWHELTIFLIIGVIGLILNEVILWFGTSLFGLHYLVSKLYSAVLLFIWNFFARKLLLF